jgi:hypothetical protein
MLHSSKICCRSPKLLHPQTRIQSQIKPRTASKSPNVHSQNQYRNSILNSFLDNPVDSRMCAEKQNWQQRNITEKKILFSGIPNEGKGISDDVINDWEVRLNRLEKLASIDQRIGRIRHLEPNLMSRQPNKKADPLGTVKIEAVARLREKKEPQKATPANGITVYRRVSINTNLKSPKRRRNRYF